MSILTILIGACYLDFPANILGGYIARSSVIPAPLCPPPPTVWPSPQSVQQAAEALKKASRPLVIVGKGKLLCVTMCI